MNKTTGSLFLLVGTIMGAGMLGLPLVSAPYGFFYSIAGMGAMCVLMAVTGSMVLKVSLAMGKENCTFSSMTENTLGYAAKVIVGIIFLLKFYSITAAYIAGGSELLGVLAKSALGVDLEPLIGALCIVTVLGSVVCWSTHATVTVNKFLLSFKGIMLVVALSALLPYGSLEQLSASHATLLGWGWFEAFPVFLVAFTYQPVIPSIRMYLDNAASLRKIVVAAPLIAFLVYTAWVGIIFSILPADSIGSGLDTMVGNLLTKVDDSCVTFALQAFVNVAMTTSFLGVTLSLFDFIADIFKRPDTRRGRMETAILTYAPPLFFAFLYPDGFVLALNFASVFCGMLCVILPMAMLYNLNKKGTVA